VKPLEKENLLEDYYQAAHFTGLDIAGVTYFRLQQMVFEAKDDVDLSVYRLKLSGMWHVVVLGERPPPELHIRIEAELTNGTLVTLRDDAIRYLQERRARATLLGPWVERHYHLPKEEK